MLQSELKGVCVRKLITAKEGTKQQMDEARIQGLLRQGISATKAGQAERARQALMQVVELDESNVQAWLWLNAVMDDPIDKFTCLQNVLGLDPDNKPAQAGLARLEQETAGVAPKPGPEAVEPNTPPVQVAESTHSPPPSSPPPSPESSPAKPARIERSPGGRYERLSPSSSAKKTSSQKPAHLEEHASIASALLEEKFAARRPPPESKPETPRDVFANEYLCPGCATQTQPDETKCKACGQKFWIEIPRREKPSRFFRYIRMGYILNVIIFSLGLVLVIFLTVTDPELYLEALLGIVFLVSFFTAALVLSLIMLIALNRRRRWVYRLILVDTVLRIIGSVASVYFNQGLSPVCTGSYAVLWLIIFFMVLNLGEDFTFDKQRILLRVDPDVKTGINLLERGRRYAERKMWAKAAVHFRRAAYQLSENLDAHLSLIVAYINLELYDLAVEPLARARELSPGDPKVERLQTLLDDRRGLKDPSFLTD